MGGKITDKVVPFGNDTARAVATIPNCPAPGCTNSVGYVMTPAGPACDDTCAQHAGASDDLEAALVESLRLTKRLHESGELPKLPEGPAPEGRIKPPTSKAAGPNPKDLRGRQRVSLTKVPAIALAHCAHAMMDGARKYDPYNWRAKDVTASIYIDAALRHLLAFFEGEDAAKDSGAHHLGHAMACCAILLDAQATDALLDDRPLTTRSAGVFGDTLKNLVDIEREKASGLESAT